MLRKADKEQLQKLFEAKSLIRSIDLERAGFSPTKIQTALKEQVIERLGRGIYSLPNADLTESQSLLHVVTAIPAARICLLSALRFHHLTTQNPHEVWIALSPRDWRPTLSYPPVRIQRFSGAALTEGVEDHTIQGINVQVYSVAKTIVDLFRYRNKIGIDVAIEALKEGWRHKAFEMSELDRIARQCRMSRLMQPYLEILVS